MKSEIIVDLTQFAYGGDCIGRLADGRAVFVPFGLPGERVRCRMVEEKRGFARAELLEVLEPAPARIPPRCAHYTRCGGCHFQHLDYPAQLQAKQSILRDQLARIAGIVDLPVRECVPAPAAWNYRNTLQFHLSPAGKLGFQRAGGSGVVEISECHLPEGPLNELWPRLEFEPGSLERVALRLGMDGEMLLALEGEQPPELSIEDLPVSAVYLGEDAAQAQPAQAQAVLVLAGDDHIFQEVLGRAFRVSAGSFFQVNTAMAGKLVEEALRLLDPGPGDRVLDLYCGAGLFSAFLASRVKEVIGVELSPSACADFATNLDEFDNVSLYEGAVEEILPALEAQPDLALLDPPRAGLERLALDALAGLGPRKIVYVSCDPATLARDAKRLLEAGYALQQATPFDMFPQTYHIESVALFVRR